MNFYFLFPLLFLFSCSSKKDVASLLEEARLSFHREIAKEYGAHLVEECLNNKRFRLDYEIYEETDILRARLLIHRIAETLLRKISLLEKTHGIKESLTEKNIEITISFINKAKKKQYPLIEVSHVSLLEGWIHYTRYQPSTGEIELVHREEFTSLLAALVKI